MPISPTYDNILYMTFTLWIIFFTVVCITGLVVSIFGGPGPFVIFGGILFYAVIDHFHDIDLGILGILLILSIAGEILEFLSGLIGAKKFGASKAGIIGALIGGITGSLIGSLFIPVIGSIIGALLGVFFGAFTIELINKKNAYNSLKAGLGAFVGRLGGSVTKLVLVIIMAIIVFNKIF